MTDITISKYIPTEDGYPELWQITYSLGTLHADIYAPPGIPKIRVDMIISSESSIALAEHRLERTLEKIAQGDYGE